ncbi:uncharacterized protein LOC132752943 [Ruditapes philippinarum]|uniref:uncharacterized protein LOC132752943 n=1 Tax=Ruditapes philippinarum TaxID=129788 RepID=UPI00295BCF99|nr:uncharacterized protein LOC132752943 [Ruditapes philippinarum]
MVIGCHGQGKTSLVKKLLEEGVSNVGSTNGIDVIHFDVEEDFSWKRRTIVADADTEAARRLAAVDYLDDGQEKINMYKNTTKRRLRSSSLSSSKDGETQENAKKMKVVASCSYSDQSLSQTETGQPSTFNSDIAIYKRYSSVMSNTSSEDMTGGSLIGSFWDFGGQYIFYSTHQLFHSRQAIYLLVFDLSLGLDTIIKDEDFPNKKNKKTLKDYIKFWVNSVHCFVGSNDGEEPHIILVGTHKDKLNVDEDVDDYFEDVRCIFDDSKQLRHIYSQHFAVSNIGPDTSDFLDLRKSITRLGKRLSEERAPLPARWILLEKSLKEKQHEKITSFDNVLAINKEIQYPLAEQDEVKLFLQFHHARGSLFHFNDTELSSYVVLDPQYLIDAFKCIITSKKFCSTHTHLRKPWRRLCDDAILEKALIEELWKRNPETNFLQHKDVLLGFLQCHRIIAQVQKYKGTKGFSSSPEVMDCYFVPSLLKVSSSSQLVSSFIKNNSMTQVALVYEFENDCIVETIFQRFTAAALGKWSPITFENQSLLFENLSVFEIRLDHAGMINFREGKLELLVVNLCPPEQVSSKDCDLFRCFFETVVSVEFQKLCADESGSQGKRKFFTNSVRCYNKDHELFGSKKVYRIAKIEEFAKSCIPCPDRRSHTFQARDVFDTWYNNYVEMEAVPKRLLTNKEYGKLAAGIIGRGWEHLAYELGLSKVEVEHIDDDFQRKSTKILEVLTKWRQEQLDRATLDVLVSAIRKIQTPNLTIDEDKLKAIIYNLD